MLLVSSAVAARYLERPAEKSEEKRNGWEESLNRLWGTSDNRVETFPAQAGTDLRVTVFMPAGGPERKNWNFALLRWLARRDPRLKFGLLKVIDGHSGQPLVENRLELPAYSLRNRPASAYLALEPEVLTEDLRRRTQSRADELMGQGRTLVLLETHPMPEPSAAQVERPLRCLTAGNPISGCLVTRGPVPPELVAQVAAALPEPRLRLVELPFDE